MGERDKDIEGVVKALFFYRIWFYTTVQLIRIKNLPRYPYEPEGIDHVKRPKLSAAASS